MPTDAPEKPTTLAERAKKLADAALLEHYTLDNGECAQCASVWLCARPLALAVLALLDEIKSAHQRTPERAETPKCDCTDADPRACLLPRPDYPCICSCHEPASPESAPPADPTCVFCGGSDGFKRQRAGESTPPAETNREKWLAIIEGAKFSRLRFRALQFLLVACVDADEDSAQERALEAALRELADDTEIQRWLEEERRCDIER